MRRMHVLALAAFFLVPQAFAQSTGTTPADAAKQLLGIIVSIDAIAGSVTLDNGETIMLPATIKSTDLKLGNKVRVEFGTDPMGLKVATSIAAVVDAPGAVPATPAAPKPAEAGAG